VTEKAPPAPIATWTVSLTEVLANARRPSNPANAASVVPEIVIVPPAGRGVATARCVPRAGDGVMVAGGLHRRGDEVGRDGGRPVARGVDEHDANRGRPGDERHAHGAASPRREARHGIGGQDGDRAALVDLERSRPDALGRSRGPPAGATTVAAVKAAVGGVRSGQVVATRTTPPRVGSTRSRKAPGTVMTRPGARICPPRQATDGSVAGTRDRPRQQFVARPRRVSGDDA